MARKTKYKWWGSAKEHRFDLVLMGEPDCHAYIIRYWSAQYRTSAWCWILTMPRASRNEYQGWSSNPNEAKRQVEAAILANW